jgi:hypothetical protein
MFAERYCANEELIKLAGKHLSHHDTLLQTEPVIRCSSLVHMLAKRGICGVLNRASEELNKATLCILYVCTVKLWLMRILGPLQTH